MLILWERGVAQIGDLQRCLYLETGTVTPLVKRMESAGLVERRRDPGDERRVLVSPTLKGQTLKAEAAKIPAILARQVAMSQADGAQLQQLSTGLVQALAALTQA
jgi:DNA-binding MarR family transcriptional regulator